MLPGALSGGCTTTDAWWHGFLGTASQVTRFLRDYTPKPALTPEQVEMLSQVMRERPLTVDHDTVVRELEFRSLAVQVMLEELESYF
jgi:hypothetical protein